MFSYISLHSALLAPNNSIIMLVNILLFQYYSSQICNLLFSKLCQHNRLRPKFNGVTIYKKFFCRPNSFYIMAVYTEACVESQFSGVCGLEG